MPLALILGFYSDDRRHSPGTFSILVNGRLLTVYEQVRSEPPRFYDERIAIPAALTRGKRSITLRFEAKDGSQIPAIFGTRIVRAGERA